MLGIIHHVAFRVTCRAGRTRCEVELPLTVSFPY
jgi:hypothetical protein